MRHTACPRRRRWWRPSTWRAPRVPRVLKWARGEQEVMMWRCEACGIVLGLGDDKG